MIKSELYKMRHHGTPRVLGGILLASVLAGPIYYLFKAPGTAADHLDIPQSVLGLVGALLAAVYGAWLIGHEYRQDTLKRVVAADANRGRLLWVKGLVGLGVGAAAVALVAAVGIGAGALVAEINGASVSFDGVLRDVLGSSVSILGVATLAYLASILLRSDTYAIVAVLGLILILDPLLAQLPKVGPYLPGQVLGQISDSVAGLPSVASISTASAALALGLTFGVIGAVAARLFGSQDL